MLDWDTGALGPATLGHPTLPDRLARMNRSQSRYDRVAGSRFRPKNRRNIRVAARSDR